MFSSAVKFGVVSNKLKNIFYIIPKTLFLRQNLKKFIFRVKLSDLIFFFLGLSPIVN